MLNMARYLLLLLLLACPLHAVVSSPTSAASYQGTGTTAAYPFTWGISQATDLVCYEVLVSTGAVTKLNLTTDYTVSGVGIYTGGTVTLTAGNLASGTNLLIASDPVMVQLLLLQQGAAFNPADLMNALDYLTHEVQATRRIANNGIQIPITDSLAGLNTTLPPAPQRSGQFISFDPSGNAILSAVGPAAPTQLTTVLNVAGLKNVVAPLSSVVYGTTGYTTNGDGGAGLYFWDAASVVADNAVTYIQLTGGGTGRFRLINTGIIFPEQAGAKGDGATDDTAAINAALAMGLTISFNGTKTYACHSLVAGNNIRIMGNGATLLRNSTANTPVLGIGQRCRVEYLKVNGNVGSFTGSSALTQQGIQFSDYSIILGCECWNNPGHGIAGYQTGFGATSLNGGMVIQCLAYTNGTNPGPSGTGDGVYINNGLYTIVDHCECYSNSRMGITLTTYNGTTTQTNLSNGATARNNRCYSNSYEDMDIESVTAGKAVNNYCAGLLIFDNSDYTVINGHQGGQLYSTSNYVDVRNFALTGVSGNVLHLEGNSPTVADGRCTLSAPTAGNAIEFEPANSLGSISNVRVDGCYNGFLISAATTAIGLEVTSAVNVPMKIRNGGSGFAGLSSIAGGIATVTGSASPSNGTWVKGDTVINNAMNAGQNETWVCTVAGTPGTWVRSAFSANEASATYNPGGVTAGSQATTTIAVTGSVIGDYVQASFSNALGGLQLTGWVSANGTVTAQFSNPTGGTITPGSGTLRVRVNQQ